MNYCYEFERMGVTADIIVLNTENKILLIERGGEPYKGSWALPGGYVEINEICIDGAYRELYEETHIKDIQLEHVDIADTINRDPRGRTISIIYKGLLKDDWCVTAGDDASKAQWFNLENLPDLAFDHADVIRRNTIQK